MQKAECRMQKRQPNLRLFCILSAFCILHSALPSAQEPDDGPTVVIQFDNPTQDARLGWMREGAAILLADALAAIGVPVVEREERLQAFDRLQLPANATLSRASTIRIGHALSATSVINGTIQMQGD